MRGIGWRIFPVAVAVLVVGCGGGRDTGGAAVPVTRSDSAGVEIVVSQVPPDGLPVYATLDSVPDVSLGFVLGGNVPPLFDVRGAVMLSTGNIAVAEGSTFEVRYYSPDGTWLGWLGGQGMDAGEYWELSRLGRAVGDTLWATDYTLDRLTLFEHDAGVLSTHELPKGYSVAGRFGGDSYLLVPRWSPSIQEADPREGVRRDSARYLRLWLPSGDTTVVGVFPYGQLLAVETEQGTKMELPPFGRRTSVAVGPGRFYVGDQETFVIGGYDPDGVLRQSIRLEGIDLALTPGQVAAARAATPEDSAGAEQAERFWATVPATRPAYTRILLDASGNIWVGEHVATQAPPSTWMVFGPDGAVRGLVTVPVGFVPLEIGVRFILGIVARVEGDQRVLRYPLTRREG